MMTAPSRFLPGVAVGAILAILGAAALVKCYSVGSWALLGLIPGATLLVFGVFVALYDGTKAPRDHRGRRLD